MLIYKMKKRRNERVRLMNPQPLEYVLGPEETLEIIKTEEYQNMLDKAGL